MRPLGKNQVATLKLFADGPRAFRPTRDLLPWPEMRSLSARGLMWIERRESRFWDARRIGFAHYQLKHYAGLTPDGEAALANIRERESNAQTA